MASLFGSSALRAGNRALGLQSTGRHVDSKLRAEIREIADTLQGNLDKVVQHGKRADAIVNTYDPIAASELAEGRGLNNYQELKQAIETICELNHELLRPRSPRATSGAPGSQRRHPPVAVECGGMRRRLEIAAEGQWLTRQTAGATSCDYDPRNRGRQGAAPTGIDPSPTASGGES